MWEEREAVFAETESYEAYANTYWYVYSGDNRNMLRVIKAPLFYCIIGDKPYQCNNCNKRFSEANIVTQHVRIHTGERPFKCHYSECGRKFSISGALTIHLRMHTGKRQANWISYILLTESKWDDKFFVINGPFPSPPLPHFHPPIRRETFPL